MLVLIYYHIASHCHIVAIAADIQDTTQDGTVCSQLSRLLAAATFDTCFFFFLSASLARLFNVILFVRCSRSLWHYATLISSFNNNNNNNIRGPVFEPAKHPSFHLSVPSIDSRFAAGRPTSSRYRSIGGAGARAAVGTELLSSYPWGSHTHGRAGRRPVANASSDALTADVRGWTQQTCLS